MNSNSRLKPQWIHQSEDDLISYYFGWVLRVEQMHKDYWWWQVSKGDVWMSDSLAEEFARTKSEAQELAEKYLFKLMEDV